MSIFVGISSHQLRNLQAKNLRPKQNNDAGERIPGRLRILLFLSVVLVNFTKERPIKTSKNNEQKQLSTYVLIRRHGSKRKCEV